MGIVIYGLFCPISGRLRYVGKTKNVEFRLRRHVSTARRGFDSHRDRWVRTLLAQGAAPTMAILRHVQPGECWASAEREEIARALARGERLTNSTAGGDGVDPIDATVAAEWSRKKRANGERIWRDPEIRRKMVDSIRVAKARESAAIAEASRKMHAVPGFREKHAEATRAALADPTTKQRMANASKAKWGDDAYRTIRLATSSAPETKAKQSAAAKRRWSDPVKREAALAANQSPERRAKLSAAASARVTPEYRLLMAEKTRLSWEKRKSIAR